MENQEQIVSTPSVQELPPFRSFSVQLKDAWQLYTSNFWRFVGLTLFSIFVPMILMIAAVVLPLFSIFFFSKEGAQFMKYLTWLSGVSGLISLVAILISFIGFIALFVLISEEREGKIGRSLKIGFRLFFRFIGGGILIGLILLLSSLLFLVPGLILAVIFSFWPFIVIKENAGAIAAIKKCFQLVKGHFWIVCLRYFTFFLIAGALNLILALLWLMLWPINLGLALVVFLIHLIVIYFLINVLNFIFIYVIYKDTSARKAIDAQAKYKLSLREKIFLILLVVVPLLISVFFQYFLQEKQPTIKKSAVSPEEAAIYKLLQEQGAPIQPPLENVSLTPEEQRALEERKPVNIIRDQQRLEDLKKIRSALDAYFKDRGEYPRAKGILGEDFVCLVSYTAIPTYRGLISAAQLAEVPYVCINADKIYLESFQSLPSMSYPASTFGYDSLCSIECLPGEKNNFYTINFVLETSSADLKTALESDLENLRYGLNCLTSDGIKSAVNPVGEMGGCVSQEIADADEDDLNDFREIYIYKTDRFNPDTDGDGYLDGAEVRAGYNPNGPGELRR